MLKIKNWWKWAGVILVLYSLILGLLMEVPRLPILNESIRNLFFHVPMWFGMVILLSVSVVFAIVFLSSDNMKDDDKTVAFVQAGVLFGILGMITGMLWAKVTWGEYWSNDPKQNASAIGLLIYFAYLVLRASIEDRYMRAKVTSVYNIFAFAALIPLLFILPRMTDSLHPGSGGNPAFNIYDLDDKMRLVFYPAVIGWTLMGVWMATIVFRLRLLKSKIYETDA